MGNDITEVTFKLTRICCVDVTVAGVSVACVTDWGRALMGLYGGKAVSCTGYIRLGFMI